MIKGLFSRLKKLVHEDLWEVSSRTLPVYKGVPLKLARMMVISIRDVLADRCYLRASALTFYTLLAIVPLLAVAFGIAKGFGFESMLESEIMRRFGGHEEVMTRVIEFSRDLLEEARGGVISSVGLLVLFWSAFKVLKHVETALNDLWGVENARGLARRMADYLVIMFVCPLLLVVSSSLTVAAGKYISSAGDLLPFWWALSPAASLVLELLPFCTVWVVFIFVYMALPNTRVRLLPGLTGGILAGTLYQVVQSLHIQFQIGVSRANVIYGSFAALPLFLIWLQISWLIFLFGAEFSFAHQNVDTLDLQEESENASYCYRLLFCLRICALLAKRFVDGEPALSAEEIADRLEMPPRMIGQLLHDMVDAGLLSETIRRDSTLAYQPGMAVSNLTVRKVTEILMRTGGRDMPVKRSPEIVKLHESLQSFSEAIQNSPGNMPLTEV